MHNDDGLNRTGTAAPARSRSAPARLIAVALALVIAPAAAQQQATQQQAAPGNTLEDIEFVPMSGERVRMILKLSGPAPEPISFTIDDPARIALDLPDTANALEQRFQDINVGLAQSVNTAQAGDRTRVVVNLADLVPYNTRVEGNNVVVSLNESAQAAAAATADAGEEPAAPQGDRRAGAEDAAEQRPTREVRAERQPGTGPPTVENIDFRRGEEGEGRVMLRLSKPSEKMDIREQGGRTIVDLPQTRLPRDMVQRFDVIDFATPVKFVDATRANGGTRLTITPAEGRRFERLAYQSENRVAVEFRPVTEEEEEERKEPEYTGERITLNFQDVEVRSVLQILADVAGINMVVSDTVQGTLALRLQNVPWDQALDIILRSKGLGKQREGNVMFVAPAQEIAARRQQQLESQEKLEQLAPLRSEFIQVNYAQASELASLIQSGGGEDGGGAMVSERGSVTVDGRTNTLLVRETADRLDDIRALVERLDIPVRQVLIESRIVVANDDFNRDIGVRFGATGVDDFQDSGVIAGSGTLQGTNTIVNSALTNRQATGQPFPVQFPSNTSDRLNVNVPAGSPVGSFGLGILGDDFLVDLELSAAQAENRGEIISSPRVITADQKEAIIRQGVEIPFQEAASSGATSVSFKDAVLELAVTPQITPDDRVIMNLNVQNDTVGENVPSGVGGMIPSIDTRELQTRVLVNNGETVVLGGIYEQETRESVNKVPVLGDIPLLGRLFRQNSKTNNKSELLVFVTPKILKEGLTTTDLEQAQVGSPGAAGGQ